MHSACVMLCMPCGLAQGCAGRMSVFASAIFQINQILGGGVAVGEDPLHIPPDWREWVSAELRITNSASGTLGFLCLLACAAL